MKQNITPEEAERIRDRALEAAIQSLETAVLLTPSGEARNMLCNAAIFVSEASERIARIVAAKKGQL